MPTHAPPHPSPATQQDYASPSTRHRWLPAAGPGFRARAGVALRAVAAIGGGYALSALAAASLSIGLPMARAEASITATLTAFVLYACAAMWVFAARTVWLAWLGLVLAALPFGALLLVQLSTGSAA